VFQAEKEAAALPLRAAAFPEAVAVLSAPVLPEVDENSAGCRMNCFMKAEIFEVQLFFI